MLSWLHPLYDQESKIKWNKWNMVIEIMKHVYIIKEQN